MARAGAGGRGRAWAGAGGRGGRGGCPRLPRSRGGEEGGHLFGRALHERGAGRLVVALVLLCTRDLLWPRLRGRSPRRLVHLSGLRGALLAVDV